MSKDIPLTTLDQKFNEMVRNTPSGMAYWSGTGPEGVTCRTCLWWGHNGDTTFPQKEVEYASTGQLKAARCGKYKILSYREGKAIPHESVACKYYEPTEDSPAPFKPKAVGTQ